MNDFSKALIIPMFLCALTLPAVGDVELAREGQSTLPILLPKDPHPQEKMAAQQLATYLKQISGAEFPVRAASGPLPARAILIGAVGPAPAQGLADDEFIVRADGQRLQIAGGSPLGTLHGVFAFLEDVLGCRWWSHTEEDVPRRATLAVPEMNRVVRAPFSIHFMMNREAQSPLNLFVYKARMQGSEYFTGGHTLYPLLVPYAQTHPEIYPMDKEGQRKPNNLHFCYMAPGIAEALADALSKQVEKANRNVKGPIYFAGMGDWYGGMCECPTCRRIYEEETWTDPDGRKKPGYMATLLRMINRTAEILDQRYPGIRVGTFAYMSLEAPPAKTVPQHNVVIRIPRLRHCTLHPAASCEVNRSFLRNLEQWCRLAPGRVYIWDYGANFKNFLYPFPCIHSIAENIRLYRRLGVRGVMVQGNYVTTGSDLVVLKNYVWRKLMWDPSRDTDELVEEFCRGYYGPAGPEMIRYVQELERSVAAPREIHANEFAPVEEYLAPETIRALRRIADRAVALTQGQEPYLRRVKEAVFSLDVLALSTPGPLVEQDGRLVRQDLGDSLPRAEIVATFARQAGPTEWNTGESWWLNYLALHGGPLVTLARGALQVKVAPLLNAQIRQITWRGTPLLYVERDPSTKGYPVVGGSITAIGHPRKRLVGDPTTTQVTLEDGIEIPGWHFNRKPSLVLAIALEADDRISIIGRALQGAKLREGTVTTSYPFGEGAAAAQVEYQTPDGHWERVVFSKGNTDVDLPGVAALRITLPSARCVVVDRYLSPPAKATKLTHDLQKGVLTTIVTIPGVTEAPRGEREFFRRDVQVLPLAPEEAA